MCVSKTTTQACSTPISSVCSSSIESMIHPLGTLSEVDIDKDSVLIGFKGALGEGVEALQPVMVPMAKVNVA